MKPLQATWKATCCKWHYLKMVYITQTASYSALDSVFELYISHAKSSINGSNQDFVRSGLLNEITSDSIFPYENCSRNLDYNLSLSGGAP